MMGCDLLDEAQGEAAEEKLARRQPTVGGWSDSVCTSAFAADDRVCGQTRAASYLGTDSALFHSACPHVEQNFAPGAIVFWQCWQIAA